MTRATRTVFLLCAAAIALANCNSSPTTPSSSDAGGVVAEAGPNGETLKAHAPTGLSPNNDFRLDSRRPVMVVTNVQGKFVEASFFYEFELLTDANAFIARTTLPGGDRTTTWSYPVDLERDTPYKWRARARKGGAVGPWSSTARFLTLFEKRAPDPAPGTRLPLPDHFYIVQQVAAQYPGALRNSCQDHGGSWEFMDRVIDAMRLEDTRWGYNWKRGVPGDPSQDLIVYNHSAGPDEGNPNVYGIDIIGGHCTSNPSPNWLNQTGVGGSGAAWTSRGRW